MIATATVKWSKGGTEAFTDMKYGRAHSWHFDGGAEVKAAASPQNVPAAYTDTSAVDPEEAFVAAVSSCHMLWFLYFAAQKKWVVGSYTDKASGILEKNEYGKEAFTVVELRPVVEFVGERTPSAEELANLHHKAHENCFIAHSIKAEVKVL